MILRCLHGAALLALLGLVLACPAQGVRAAAEGLRVAAGQVVPTLFPFFVVSGLLAGCPAARRAGALLCPVTRALGLRSRAAPTALLLGWLGGFAVAARVIGQLYTAGQLSRREAQGLLLCAVGSSPAFVVNTVGLLLLGRPAAGWLLLGALLAANLGTALVCRWLWGQEKEAGEPLPPDGGAGAAASTGLVEAVRGAVDATLLVCGFVVFFQFVCGLLGAVLPLSAQGRFWVCALLEVSAGCRAGAALPHPLYACCAALSLEGLSVLMQVRALLPAGLQIRPLVLARAVHLPLALGLLWLEVRCWPQAAEAGCTLAGRVITRSRAPLDAALLLAFLICAVLRLLHPEEQ